MPHKDPQIRAAWHRAYRLRNAESLRQKKAAYHQANAPKICKKSREWRRENLERAKTRQQTYHKVHALEILAKVTAWNKANPERHRASVRIRVERRRARKHNTSINDFTIAQWKTMKLHYGNRCVYCKKKSQRLTMDHITPLSKGGNHTQANIVPACRSCNARKMIGPPPVPVQPMLL